MNLETIISESGVAFGTSGARGLVSSLTDTVAYAYSSAFLNYLKGTGQSFNTVAVAGDLRSSTGRIMAAVGKAVSDHGAEVIHCGRIPSPALADFGFKRSIPTVMITGSHIPDDRNGIKYNSCFGEILKSDEAGIKSQILDLPDIFDDSGQLQEKYQLPAVDSTAADDYRKRYLDCFPEALLADKTIGIYEHSAVGRDLIKDLLISLGAEVIGLGRSDAFIPVDTEAIRPEDSQLAAAWAKEYDLDAIVSTDGDSDRPLVSDENGKWLRGDIVGIC